LSVIVAVFPRLVVNGISAGNVFATLDLRDGRSPSVSMLAKMGLALG